MFPIAFVFMMSVMGGYAKDYEGAVKTTGEMSSAMIEYIDGIEVIKAFSPASMRISSADAKRPRDGRYKGVKH